MIPSFATSFLSRKLIYALDMPSFQRDFASLKTLDHGTGPNITFTRASGATYFDANGVLQTAANNAPRFDHDPATGASRGLLIEEARTNSIRNAQAGGAVVGTPGTVPTNWTASIQTGLTREIVATGTVNGMSYVDIRISGTADNTGANAVHFETTTQVAALQNETWTTSASVALVGGTLANVANVGIGFAETDSGGVAITSGVITGFTPTATLARYSGTRTLANASTAFYRPNVRFAAGNTVDPIDFTLRIAAPQLEKGAFATSYIPTTTAAATRSADSAVVTPISSFYNVNEGTFFCEAAPASLGKVQGFWACGDNTKSFAARNVFYHQSDTSTGQSGLGHAINGSDVGSFTGVMAGNYTAGVSQKTIYAAATDNSVGAFGGTLGTVDTSCAMPSGLNAMSIASLHAGWNAATSHLNGHIRKFAYWPRRLSNTLLQQLTT